MRANERTDERVAQYCSLYSWLFSTIVKGGQRMEVVRGEEEGYVEATNEGEGGEKRGKMVGEDA